LSWVRAPSATPDEIRKACYSKDSRIFSLVCDVKADVQRFSALPYLANELTVSPASTARSSVDFCGNEMIELVISTEATLPMCSSRHGCRVGQHHGIYARYAIRYRNITPLLFFAAQRPIDKPVVRSPRPVGVMGCTPMPPVGSILTLTKVRGAAAPASGLGRRS
jgi:hypothetical protein